MEIVELHWDFDNAGEWTAWSNSGREFGEACKYAYRVQVCRDGTFDVSRSDQQLGMKYYRCFETLRAAQDACERRETGLLAKAEGRS